MAYVDFPDDINGRKDRKAFFLSKDGLTLIAGWRRQGIPLKKIAEDYVGISSTAWWGWYRESEALRDACAVSLDITNATVEEALLKRALGYTYNEETYELVEGEMRLTKTVTKHVQPDVKAILSWLFNRMPNKWRAIQEPLESVQYVETVKNILVAMKEVAENQDKVIEIDAREAADGE